MELRLNSFFANNYQPIIVVDRQCEIIEFNDAAISWTRSVHGRELRTGESVLGYLAPEDVDEFTGGLSDVLDGGKERHRFFSVTPGAGGDYWFQYHLYPLEKGDRIGYAQLVVADISERKNAIDEMARNARRFQSIISNSMDIVCVIEKNGAISFISDFVEQVLGYKPFELLGTILANLVFHEDRERIEARLRNAAESREQVFDVQFRLKHKEEFWVFVEAMITNLLYDESVRGIVLNMRDVTERKHVESMLLKISRQNELILESAGEGIYGINTSGLITFANPAAARMLGFRVEDMIGRNHSDFLELFAPDEKPEEWSGSESAPREEERQMAASARFMLKRTNDTWFPAECVATPIREKGGIVGAVVTFKDVSDSVRAEEDLRRSRDEANAANRAKSEFLANVSHEVRTPINSIIGFLDLLAETRLGRTQEEYVRIGRQSAQTLLEIIDDILDYSKIEKGKIEIAPHEFDPMNAFESTIEIFSARALAKRISLHAFIDPRMPGSLVGDELRIKQVLNNLIGNAVKFTPEGGEIFVEVARGDETERACPLHFSVKDNGIGIPEDKQHIIFQSFTQADSSIARTYGGTGLGLAISSNLVALMGGVLGLESREGFGSTFSFTLLLPVGTKREYARSVSGRTVCAAVLAAGESIGLGEKNMERYLNAMGVQAAVVASVKEIASRGGFDVVFGCMGSLDVDSLRAAGSLEIPLVMEGEESRRTKAEDAGADLFIVKPANASKLLRALCAVNLCGEESAPPLRERVPEFESNARVLLAEDTKANRELMRIMLEKLGAKATEASNGEEAVTLWRKGAFDIIFMDINMPVCDGLEATRRIRALERQKPSGRTAIIALTARAVRGDEETFLAAGMDGYIAKPVRMDSIAATLARYLPSSVRRRGDDAEAIPAIETLVEVLGIDEESLRELLREMLDASDEYTVPLRTHIDDNSLKDIRFLAHRLKGVSGNYMLTMLAEVAGRMERAAEASENADYRAMLDEIEGEFSRLKKRFGTGGSL